MDISIFYRIVYQPGKVFQQWHEKPRSEPFIFLGIVALLSTLHAYIGATDKITLFLLLLAFFQSVISLLIFPFMNAVFISLVVRFIFGGHVNIIALISAFILCEIPTFIEGFLGELGLLSFFDVARPHPFLYGILLLITPFSVWSFILVWFALKGLIILRSTQYRLIFLLLILINTIISGAFNYFISIVVK